MDFLGEFNDKIDIDRSTAVMDTLICAFGIPILPIVEQDTVRIDHGDSMEDMVRYGRDIEKTVLARGLRYHVEFRVLICGSKTIVFK